MASETPQEEVVSVELPAPHGWKKQFFPKRGGTPRKSEIVFTAPTGDEIHNQRQLQLYLKAHSGGPLASDFDWGTGESPRRSARISEKTKSTPITPESDPPTKRRRSSLSKKDIEGNGSAADEETKAQEVEVKDGEKTEDDEKVTDEAVKEAQTQTDEVKASEGSDAEKIGPRVVEEVAKEDENEVKDTSEPKEVAKEDNENACVEDDDKIKEEGKQEHAKTDAESEVGDEKQTEVNPSAVTGHENNRVENEKPEPKSEDADVAESKGDDVAKAVEVAENGIQGS